MKTSAVPLALAEADPGEKGVAAPDPLDELAGATGPAAGLDEVDDISVHGRRQLDVVGPGPHVLIDAGLEVRLDDTGHGEQNATRGRHHDSVPGGDALRAVRTHATSLRRTSISTHSLSFHSTRRGAPPKDRYTAGGASTIRSAANT